MEQLACNASFSFRVSGPGAETSSMFIFHANEPDLANRIVQVHAITRQDSVVVRRQLRRS